MRSSRRIALAPVVALAALATMPDRALTQERHAMVLSASAALPIASGDAVGSSEGFALELDLMPDADDLLWITAGGFAAFGLGWLDDDVARRDLYDGHFAMGMRFPIAWGLQPHFAVGIDILSIATYSGDEVARGTTMGASARVGFASYFGDRFLLRFDAVFLGAIVPGTGDALETLVLTLGIGVGEAEDYEEDDDDYPPPPPPPAEGPVPLPIGPPIPNAMPPEVSRRAAALLACPENQVGGSHLEDAHIGCEPGTDCEASMLYRRFRAVGCNREILLRCYSAAPGGPLECMQDVAP